MAAAPVTIDGTEFHHCSAAARYTQTQRQTLVYRHRHRHRHRYRHIDTDVQTQTQTHKHTYTQIDTGTQVHKHIAHTHTTLCRLARTLAHRPRTRCRYRAMTSLVAPTGRTSPAVQPYPGRRGRPRGTFTMTPGAIKYDCACAGAEAIHYSPAMNRWRRCDWLCSYSTAPCLDGRWTVDIGSAPQPGYRQWYNRCRRNVALSLP